jgi:lambda repressor-like predicted transcriptional regulator
MLNPIYKGIEVVRKAESIHRKQIILALNDHGVNISQLAKAAQISEAEVLDVLEEHGW